MTHRIKNYVSTLLLGLTLSFASVPPVVWPLGVAVTLPVTVGFKGCFEKESDVVKVENKLNQAANSLNALAKTNRRLYQTNVINLQNRQDVAGVINKANRGLDKVVDRVYEIKPDDAGSIQLGKDDVVKLLQGVVGDLGSVQILNEEIRLAIQAIIALVNEGIALTQQIKAVARG